MKKQYLKLLAFIMLANLSLGLSAQTPLENSAYQTIIEAYLEDNAKDYGLKSDDLQSLFITNEYYSESTQLTHVYLNQAFEGVLIHNAISSVAIKNNKVFYYANAFINDIDEKVTNSTASTSAEQAILKVANEFQLGQVLDLNLISENGDRKIYTHGNISQRDITANKVYFNKEDTLKLVWDITVYAKDGSHWWRVKVDAQNNTILDVQDYLLSCNFGEEAHLHANHETLNAELFSQNFAAASMVADGSSYNVFALPVESPNHGTRSIVSNPASDLASPFGWHDDDGITGPEFTITRGNNVWAQEDRNANNGIGFSPEGTSNLDFDFPLNLNQPPSSYESASVTNLFYTNNMMHDIWYHHGFDEASGNFQTTNYTNQGIGNDFVFADAQDGSGLNNAVFGTPPEGQNPAMTMFLWSPPGAPADFLNVITGSVAGSYFAVEANFGAPVPSPGITALMRLVEDTTPAGSNIDNIDACDNISNASEINGRIAVIRRGNCQFGLKVLQAEQAGAVAAIIVNNDGGAPFGMAPGDSGNLVTIPSVMVSQAEGEAIINALNSGETIAATLANNGPFEIDGSFDNVIIAHEYGHGISTRLTAGAFTTDCLFNEEQMGEGWSDWFGLMVTMRPTDTPDLARGIGTFAISQQTNGNGIRPARYTPDFTINPATYATTNNPGISVPHGVGFVWATVLWDLTWAYIDKYGFDPDLYNGNGGNNKVMQLVVDGLKLQPCNPGFIDGRDALLAADQATTGGVDQCMIWEVFAARGLGVNATQGSSFSRSDQIEDFSTPPVDDPSLANCDTLSTDEFSLNSVRVYPNPTDNLLNISTTKNYGEVRLTLVDINGRTVLETTRDFNSKIELDLSQLNDGLYILNINGSKFDYNTKVIKN